MQFITEPNSKEKWKGNPLIHYYENNEQSHGTIYVS